MCLHTVPRTATSHQQTKGSPLKSLEDLLPDYMRKQWTSVHRRVSEIDRLLPIGQVLEGKPPTRMCLTGDLERLANKEGDLDVLKNAFAFLSEEYASSELAAMCTCEEYVTVYSGEGFMPLEGERNISSLGKLEQHPMFDDILTLSDITLETFGCSGETVISKTNAIYIALLYVKETPAYYVGKAAGGIKDRWWTAHTSHCKVMNYIIGCFKCPPASEGVDHKTKSDLAFAGAIMKQVATRSADGVVLFAIDFCPKGTTKCCIPDHDQCSMMAQSINHHEQHYMNAFKHLYPDSDKEAKSKMLCLNAIDSTSHHEHPDDCSSEVALSLLLHI